MVDGGTMGELKALYKKKIPYKVNFVAISEFGGISRGGIAGYKCIMYLVLCNNFCSSFCKNIKTCN